MLREKGILISIVYLAENWPPYTSSRFLVKRKLQIKFEIVFFFSPFKRSALNWRFLKLIRLLASTVEDCKHWQCLLRLALHL